jgi:hypothetical protein
MPTKKAKKKAAKKKTKPAPARKAVKKAPAKKAKRASAKPAPKAVAKGRAKKAKPAKRAKPVKAAKPLAKKPAPKKVAAKKPAAKKVAVAKPGVARAKPIQRRDHAGHIDPKYGAELRRQGTPKDAEPSNFVNRPRSSDALVEELGEEFVEEATSAEYKAEDTLNQDVTEEVGGPFVETGGATEFASGTDASNPETATREPFPRT